VFVVIFVVVVVVVVVVALLNVKLLLFSPIIAVGFCVCNFIIVI